MSQCGNEPRDGYSLGGLNHLLTIDPKTGQRSYAANAYFAPNADRPNLLVLTDALAQKVGENLQDHVIGANMFDLKEPLPETHKVSFLTTANLPLAEITRENPLDVNIGASDKTALQEYKLKHSALSHPQHAVASLVGAASGKATSSIERGHANGIAPVSL